MDSLSEIMIVTLIHSLLSSLVTRRPSTIVKTTKTTSQTQTFTNSSTLKLSSQVVQNFLSSCGIWICFSVMSLLVKLGSILKIDTSLLIGDLSTTSPSSIDSSIIQAVPSLKELSNCLQKSSLYQLISGISQLSIFLQNHLISM